MPYTPLPIPETKPATEFIDGRMVQKMSPYGLHARVQRAVATVLGDWCDDAGRGRVGTEWDYDLTPPDQKTNRLVPDVAFLSFDRVPYEDEASAQVPTVAPNVAFEILSEGQTLANSARRMEIFLQCGSDAVVLIDPRRERAWIVDTTSTREIGPNGAIEHASLPGFSLPLERCFRLVPPGGYR